MKIRTMLALGVGYAIGAKLAPEKLDDVARSLLSDGRSRTGLPMTRHVDDVVWPDASFRP